MTVGLMQPRTAAINLALHPKQKIALESQATEILYGGAAGGGKSHLLRVASILWCAQIQGLQVYLFRRQSVDLEKNHLHGPSGFHSMLNEWVNSGLCEIVKGTIRFWNGSKIFLCHCKDENDIYQYQGAEIHCLLIDEATHFTEDMYRFLRSRVRATGLKLKNGLEKYFPRIVLSSNPGNIGHEWCKRYFIESAEPEVVWRVPKEEGGKLRQFIPALLEDNPTLTSEDPNYEYSLLGLGSPALVEAMRYGNWNIMAGAYFPEFGARHVIQPFTIPDWWMRFRAFDWGSAKPFCCQWWAVSDGEIPSIPKGALVCYREWYGAKGIDEGLRLTVEQIAEGIKERETPKEQFSYSVADKAIFTVDGGPSMAERFSLRGVHWCGVDKSRVAGWDEMRQRLRDDADGNPMLFIFSTCKDLIRTFPIMINDSRKPEDIDTTLEDHAMDTARYACMSRPMVRKKPSEKQPIKGIEAVSLDQLYKLDEQFKDELYG